jgi:hypothetical protein
MSKFFTRVSALADLPGVATDSVVSPSLVPGPGNPNYSGFDTSTLQNIVFGVIATTLTIVSVLITFLQYRHVRGSTSLLTPASIDLELGSIQFGTELTTMDEAEVDVCLI